MVLLDQSPWPAAQQGGAKPLSCGRADVVVQSVADVEDLFGRMRNPAHDLGEERRVGLLDAEIVRSDDQVRPEVEGAQDGSGSDGLVAGDPSHSPASRSARRLGRTSG